MALLQLQNSVSTMRKELKNLRAQVDSLKHMLKGELLSIRRMVSSCSHKRGTVAPVLPPKKTQSQCSETSLISTLSSAAIGIARTCFREKNGTPRQPGLCPNATGCIQLERFTSPNHALEGLEDYSHAWLLFVFHHNRQDSVKSKVKPPRLGGQKMGVFATRSPHRPCPVGLSLVRVERVADNTVYVSGIDMIDGTPILDIKPYVPAYDNPARHLEVKATSISDEGVKATSSVRVAPWMECPPVPHLDVEFTAKAEKQLRLFHCQDQPSSNPDPHIKSDTPQTGASEDPDIGNTATEPAYEESPYLLQTFPSVCNARQAIVSILQQDPRSLYRRDKCSQEPYKFSIDNLNISCQFTEKKAIVTDIRPKTVWRYSKV